LASSRAIKKTASDGPSWGRPDACSTEKVGLERSLAYVTNAVKHFKYEQRGERRLHNSPNTYEIQQCRWWLDREITAIHPKLLVALGSTAAHALMGRVVTLSRERGRLLHWCDGVAGLATIPPSAVLRKRDDNSRRREFDGLTSDLLLARRFAETL
jgi:uracil-DNA glycosylase family 4